MKKSRNTAKIEGMKTNYTKPFSLILVLIVIALIIICVSRYANDPVVQEPVATTTVSTIVTTTATTSGWKIAVDEKQEVSFSYPEKLGTTYINTVEWPPRIIIENRDFECINAESEKRTIGGRLYCITQENEGAAGSTYSNYTYAFSVGNKLAILTFSTKEVQCGNYDQPKQNECKTERDTFNIDSIVDEIAQTVRFK